MAKKQTGDFMDPMGPEPELKDVDEAPDDDMPEGPKNDVVRERPRPDGAEPPRGFGEDDPSTEPEPPTEEN